ncbi:hypothetical protein ACTMU2_42175 [Cupriavidus basilensis]
MIEVSGRLYPVEIRYRPIRQDAPADGLPKSAQARERDLYDGIVDAVDELLPSRPRRRAGVPAGRARDPRDRRGAAQASSAAHGNPAAVRAPRRCRSR